MRLRDLAVRVRGSRCVCPSLSSQGIHYCQCARSGRGPGSAAPQRRGSGLDGRSRAAFVVVVECRGHFGCAQDERVGSLGACMLMIGHQVRWRFSLGSPIILTLAAVVGANRCAASLMGLLRLGRHSCTSGGPSGRNTDPGTLGANDELRILKADQYASTSSRSRASYHHRLFTLELVLASSSSA